MPFFRQKSRTLNEVLFWTPRSKFLDFGPWSKPGVHPGSKNVCRSGSIKGPKEINNIPMKKRSTDSNREKQHIYYQNIEGVHRVKKRILHPPFSENQPEKAEKGTFFVGSTRTQF